MLTAWNDGCLALAAPPPVAWGSCRRPVPRTAVKQPRPSETRVAGAASDCAANSLMDSLVKGRLDRHMRTGSPDSVVCTAATNATLLGEPRPALAPWISPPR